MTHTYTCPMTGNKITLCDNGRYGENGQFPDTGLWVNRYYARKAARGHQVTVKVDGGYTNMEPDQYRTWRAQK